MRIECSRCGAGLAVPGGLLFSPPQGQYRGRGVVCRKDHLCLTCFATVRAFIESFPSPFPGKDATNDDVR